MFKDRIDLYKKLRDSSFKTEKLTCPECGQHAIDFQYVGDESTRIGYLDMWCGACNKGEHFSRVSIPEAVGLIPFDAPDEIITLRIPNYEPVVESADE